MIFETINSFNYIAFTGSRETVDCQFSQINLICENYQGNVLVGDAKGIDAYVRKLWQNAEIFNVSDYWKGKINKAAFAVRSQAMIKSLHSRGGLLIAFPSKGCPEGLKPSKSAFSGYGSGTWATAAYAMALDINCLLWLPNELQPPQQWKLVSAGDGWWSSLNQRDRLKNKYEQLTLGF